MSDIMNQYVMKPEAYELWSRRDNNIFISPDAADDIVEHYELTKGDVISFYTLGKRLIIDRDFAELHGLDMSSDEELIRDLSKLGFVSRTGYEDDYSMDYKICHDNVTSPSGESFVVMMIIDQY